MMLRLALLLFVVASLGVVSGSFAQEEPPVVDPAAVEAVKAVSAAADEAVKKAPIKSLVFLPSVYPHVVTAKLEFLKNVNKTKEQVQEEIKAEVQAALPTGPRDIYLDGIVFRKDNDWVVWLNGEKLTPKNLPISVRDIRVTKEAVELQWYDDFTKMIYPIRIRPNQTFNLDSRFYYPSSRAIRNKSDDSNTSSR